jgi:hypothetical protein
MRAGHVSWTMATDRDGVLAGGSAAAVVLRRGRRGRRHRVGPAPGIYRLSRVVTFGAA